MAKTKSESGGDDKKINKSQAIREALDEHPRAKSKEIVALLAEKGIKVAPTLVYYVKSKRRQAKARQKREQIAEASRRTSAPNPVQLVQRVKSLAEEVGGIRNLKHLVDLLAQ